MLKGRAEAAGSIPAASIPPVLPGIARSRGALQNGDFFMRSLFRVRIATSPDAFRLRRFLRRFFVDPFAAHRGPLAMTDLNHAVQRPRGRRWTARYRGATQARQGLSTGRTDDNHLRASLLTTP